MTVRVLVAGESWSSYAFHVKGASAYSTASYEEGAAPLIEALEEGGCEVTYLPNHHAVERFPYQVDELVAAVDVVILSDLPSDSLLLPKAVFVAGERRPDRLAMLGEYVRAGGGLLMVGGYMSFAGYDGKARYGMTALADILPVQVALQDDRVETPQGLVPRVVGKHPIVDGLGSDWPYFLGYNRVTSKPESETPVTIGNDPLLVTSRRGNGRVASFTSDCAPHWGSPQFLTWPGYATLWCRTVQWLAGQLD